MVEARLLGATSDEFLQKLLATGAEIVPGRYPIPMVGGSRIFTLTVPDKTMEEHLRAIPGVIEIYSDPKIASSSDFFLP